MCECRSLTYTACLDFVGFFRYSCAYSCLIPGFEQYHLFSRRWRRVCGLVAAHIWNKATDWKTFLFWLSFVHLPVTAACVRVCSQAMGLEWTRNSLLWNRYKSRIWKSWEECSHRLEERDASWACEWARVNFSPISPKLGRTCPRIKVTKSRKQIMASSILPKNERNAPLSVFCSFWGRIDHALIYFRDLVTFSRKPENHNGINIFWDQFKNSHFCHCHFFSLQSAVALSNFQCKQKQTKQPKHLWNKSSLTKNLMDWGGFFHGINLKNEDAIVIPRFSAICE